MTDSFQLYPAQNGYTNKNGITTQPKPIELTTHSNYLSLAYSSESPSETVSRVAINQIQCPSYYPDMTQASIGNRPVYSTYSINMDIPSILLVNRDNLVDATFGCHQPTWSPNCR